MKTLMIRTLPCDSTIPLRRSDFAWTDLMLESTRRELLREKIADALQRRNFWQYLGAQTFEAPLGTPTSPSDCILYHYLTTCLGLQEGQVWVLKRWVFVAINPDHDGDCWCKDNPYGEAFAFRLPAWAKYLSNLNIERPLFRDEIEQRLQRNGFGDPHRLILAPAESSLSHARR